MKQEITQTKFDEDIKSELILFDIVAKGLRKRILECELSEGDKKVLTKMFKNEIDWTSRINNQ